MKNRYFGLQNFLVVLAISIIQVGCGGSSDSSTTPTGGGGSGAKDDSRLTGRVSIDGSSTVFPISAAVVEEFTAVAPRVKSGVGQSGTTGGMKRFVLGEVDICDASRPIKDSEREKCAEAGIEFIELTVAFDGLAVVANPKNDWCDCLTVEQLKKIWEPEAEDKIMKWSDVNPEWPDEKFELFGPGTDSGTFEYFTDAICGEEGASRPDYQPNEDDNTLVRGVAAEKGALCYFGYAYYEHNKEILKLIGIDSGEGCVLPQEKTVRDGSYKPLSRPLFIYVLKSSLQRPEVRKFVEFYLENVGELAKLEGYVPVSDDVAAKNKEILSAALVN